MKRIAVAAVLVAMVSNPASAHASEHKPMTFKQAQASTLAHYGTAVIVLSICREHHANDHYWRVGFCTGKDHYKSKLIVRDVKQGEQARIRWAEHKQFTIFANDVVCPRGCPRPYV